MPDEDFFIPIEDSEEERIRVEYFRDRRTVLTFTVQYETAIDGRFFPVVRYDSAHDRPHRDTLNFQGTLVSKQWLPNLTYNEAMTFGIKDIRENWREYRKQFVGEES